MATEQLVQTAKEADSGKGGKRSHKRRNIIIVAVVVVVLAVLGVLAAFVLTGALAPGWAAAKYNTLSYVAEEDVTDYVNIYRTQNGYADSSDEEWAQFLIAQNTDPDSLRTMSIYELVADDLIQQKCDELGITVSDEELDQVIDNLKSYMAMGDEGTWQEQLSKYGTTEEDVRQVYRLSLLKNKMLTQEVETPTPTDAQVKSYITSAITTMEDATVRHTFCFKISGLDEGSSTDKISKVQKIRKELMDTGVTEETFGAYVKMYSDDDELVENLGANGWDIDTSGYSANYQQAVMGMEEGEVSQVFVDDDGYAFIWCDQTYTLPTTQKKINKLDLDEMPSSLRQYFSDSEAYALWQEAGTEYTDAMIDAANVVIFPASTDIDYYVDLDQYRSTSSQGGSAGSAQGSDSETDASK